MSENSCYLCGEASALYNGACRTCNRTKFAIVDLLTETRRARKDVKPTSTPTTIPPGKQKIEVFQLRRSRGESLFHPDDYIPEKEESKKKVVLQTVRVKKFHGTVPNDEED